MPGARRRVRVVREGAGAYRGARGAWTRRQSRCEGNTLIVFKVAASPKLARDDAVYDDARGDGRLRFDGGSAGVVTGTTSDFRFRFGSQRLEEDPSTNRPATRSDLRSVVGSCCYIYILTIVQYTVDYCTPSGASRTPGRAVRPQAGRRRRPPRGADAWQPPVASGSDDAGAPRPAGVSRAAQQTRRRRHDI